MFRWATIVLAIALSAAALRAAPCSPEIDGKRTICGGGWTILSVDPACWTGVRWSTGDATNAITVYAAGRYSVTGFYQGVPTTAEVDVIIVPLPRPLIGNPLEYLCRGDVAVLQARDDFRAYRWSTGDTTNSIQVSQAGTYWLEVVDTNGCVGRSDEVRIELIDPPPAEISGPRDVCRNSATTYSTPVVGGATYQWSIDGGSILVGQGTSAVSVQWDRSGSLQVRVTSPRPDGGVCDSTTSSFVTARNRLKPEIRYTRSSLCTGDTITLEADPGYASYTWSTGETTPTIRVTEGGSYWLTVTDGNACDGVSDTLTVIEYPLPRISITGGQALCNNEPIALQAAAELNDVILWRWNTGATTAQILVTTPGTYIVQGTTINGCVSEDSVVVSQAEGLQIRTTGVDFGTVKAGRPVQRSILLENTGTDDVVVENILMAQPLVVITPGAPRVVPAGTSVTFTVTWFPLVNTTLRLPVVFRVATAVCEDTSMCWITGEAKADSIGAFTARIADTTLPVGTLLDLPIDMDYENPWLDTVTATLYLRIDGGVYRVDNVASGTAGVVRASDVSLNGRDHRLRIDVAIPPGISSMRAVLSGLTLLGAPFQTGVLVDSLVITAPIPFVTEHQPGSVTLTGCWLPGRLVQEAPPFTTRRLFLLDGREVFETDHCRPCLVVFQDAHGRIVHRYLTNNISR